MLLITLTTIAALAGPPKPHPEPFTAASLAGRWYQVGHPEQCKAGTHVFHYGRNNTEARYVNTAGRYGPVEAKVYMLPGNGFGVAMEAKYGDDYRGFTLQHEAKRATGDLIIAPIMPTKEEKKAKADGLYDLVKCTGDWPEAQPPPPPVVLPSDARGTDPKGVGWLTGVWGQTALDGSPHTGMFSRTCSDLSGLTPGETPPESVPGVTKSSVTQQYTYKGGLALAAHADGSVTGYQSLWGTAGFFGGSDPVDLRATLSNDTLTFTLPSGEKRMVRQIDTDHMLWLDLSGSFGPQPDMAFERCTE